MEDRDGKPRGFIDSRAAFMKVAGFLLKLSKEAVLRLRVVLWERTNCSFMYTYIYCDELFGLKEINPEKLISEKELANARIRIYMPKVRSWFFLGHNDFRV